MKIPSVNADRIRLTASLPCEVLRGAWTMPALVLGAGALFCSFGILGEGVRRGHVGPWGVHVIYAVLAAVGTLAGWSCLRGSRKPSGEPANPPCRNGRR